MIKMIGNFGSMKARRGMPTHIYYKITIGHNSWKEDQEVRKGSFILFFVFCFTLFLVPALTEAMSSIECRHATNPLQIKLKQVKPKYKVVTPPTFRYLLNVWQDYRWHTAEGKKVNITRVRYRQMGRALEFEIYLKSTDPGHLYRISNGQPIYVWSLLPDGFTMTDFNIPLKVRYGSRIYRDGNYLPKDEGVVTARWENPPLLSYIGSFKIYVGRRLTSGRPQPGYLSPDSCAVSPVRTVPRDGHLPWPPNPTISSVSPKRAKEGDVITIEGNNLPYDFWHETPGMQSGKASYHGYTHVFFRDVNVGGTKERAGEIISFNYSEIKVKVPEGAETGPVRLNYQVASWERREFSTPVTGQLVVLKPPRISKIEPTRAAPGEKLGIRGKNFWDQSSVSSQTKVRLGGKEVPIGGSPTYLSLHVPKLPPGTYKLVLSNKDGSDTADFQLVLNPPVIKSTFPKEGKVGEVLFIYCLNIDLWENSTRVYINGIPAEILEIKERAGFNDQSVKVRIPQGATSGPIAVSTKWGRTDSLKSDPPFNFTVVK
jgi:hypothetical protein